MIFKDFKTFSPTPSPIIAKLYFSFDLIIFSILKIFLVLMIDFFDSFLLFLKLIILKFYYFYKNI